MARYRYAKKYTRAQKDWSREPAPAKCATGTCGLRHEEHYRTPACDFAKITSEAVKFLSSAGESMRNGNMAEARADLGRARDEIHKAEMMLIPKASLAPEGVDIQETPAQKAQAFVPPLQMAAERAGLDIGKSEAWPGGRGFLVKRRNAAGICLVRFVVDDDGRYSTRVKGPLSRQAATLGRWKRPDTAVKRAVAWFTKMGAT